MTHSTFTSNAAINGILNHDAMIGSIFDSADDCVRAINAMKQSTISNTSFKMSGCESKHDFALAYSAERDERKWTVDGTLYFSEKRVLNFEEKRVMKLIDDLKVEYNNLKVMRSILVSRNLYDTCTSFFVISERMKMLRKDIISESRYLDEARNWKPEATIKKSFASLHGSYVKQTQRNERMIRGFINRMKLEDDIDINPINNPYAPKEQTQFIKITGFEYRKPYLVISAISADDEHDRLTDTRSMDETPEFFFTFKIAMTAEGKETPDMQRLRKFIWHKVDHNKATLAYMLRQLVGRVVTISLDSANNDFLGYPTWDVTDKIEDTSIGYCDHVGSYMNLPKHSFKSVSNSSLIAD